MPAPITSNETFTEIPPLEPGDKLSRVEFERRYHAVPELKKAELIEGVVHMPSPVRFRKHGKPHVFMGTWLGYYAGHTPGVEPGDNSSIRLDLDNMPQPDLAMIIDPAKGGQARISLDDYLEAAPELAAEVSSSSESLDMNQKFQVYRRNGVREYLVWRVREQSIDWFVLRQGVYVPLPMADGIFKSETFPGLWLDPSALVNTDIRRVIEVLEQGMATPEYEAFRARLA